MNIVEIKNNWKKLAHAKNITRVDTIRYCILRAMASKADDKLAVAKHLLHKAFSPITNRNKLLNNNNKPYKVLDPYNYGSFAGLRFGNKTVFGVELQDWEVEDFNEIYKQVTMYQGSALIRHYSYFFTRQDICPEYQLVQTAHAALELGAQLKPEQVKNLHFTCVGVESLDHLNDIECLLNGLGHKYVTFSEPDIGNEKTAIAVFPIAEHQRGKLRKFPLLRFQKQLEAIKSTEITRRINV